MHRARLLALVVPVLLCATAAHAGFTVDGCFVQKHIAWDGLRKCQRKAELQAIQGKTADPAKCQTKFDAKLVKIDAKAADAALTCRYRDNGDSTITDYDGLQWEKKSGVDVGGVFFCPGAVAAHCVTNTYVWSDANAFVASSADGAAFSGAFAGFAGHSDWRLPTVVELTSILEPMIAGCGNNTVPCLDPIFGPTIALTYWTATSQSDPTTAWMVHFGKGIISYQDKTADKYVRGVRTAL